MLARFKALWLLGTALVWVLCSKWFRRGRGLSRFRKNYEADRLVESDASERERSLAFSRCIACGWCDLGEQDRIRASRGEYPGLMSLVLHSVRSTPDLDAAARAWSHVPMEALVEKERTCPTQVPFRDIKRFVETKARVLGFRPLPVEVNTESEVP